ncbi:MAG: 4Fe-4S dicluster domain-containing protein, partial [Acidobacteriota bacterium]|nr:4Fe-4S dicluster domain-containing protein [Acidobacteriota bacterium]
FGEPRAAYDVVRETWQGLLGGASFEKRWRRVLHDGVLDGHAGSFARPPRADAPLRPGALTALQEQVAGNARPGEGALELAFRPSWALWDGRFANNGWLQETPDPVTKLAWDNAALMSPATMAARGLADEEVVALSVGGRRVEMPAWGVPGLADGTVVVTLGYGRDAAGRVGSGVGVNAYPLRTSDAPWLVSGLTIEPTGRRYPLATTQEHGSMEGRPVVREATLAEYRAHPGFAAEAVEMPPLEQPFPHHDYASGPQWGMSIDLTVCTGCNACMLACQSENNVPVVGKEQLRNGREMHWLRVDRYFVEKGEGAGMDDPEVVFQPVPCMQCENAPCEQVCPVAATTHDSEGLNVMVYNRCIGTRYCSNNCPYKVRRFNFFNYTKDKPEVERLGMNPDVTVRSRGVMEKCTYCTQRINAAKLSAKLEERSLRDGEVVTACQQACPTRAITFGDIRDTESEVSRAKSENRSYAMLAELNNRPRTTYLAKIRHPSPDLEGA